MSSSGRASPKVKVTSPLLGVAKEDGRPSNDQFKEAIKWLIEISKALFYLTEAMTRHGKAPEGGRTKQLSAANMIITPRSLTEAKKALFFELRQLNNLFRAKRKRDKYGNPIPKRVSAPVTITDIYKKYCPEAYNKSRSSGMKPLYKKFLEKFHNIDEQPIYRRNKDGQLIKTNKSKRVPGYEVRGQLRELMDTTLDYKVNDNNMNDRVRQYYEEVEKNSRNDTEKENAKVIASAIGKDNIGSVLKKTTKNSSKKSKKDGKTSVPFDGNTLNPANVMSLLNLLIIPTAVTKQ